jgi:hypothetical protein
LNLSAKIRIGLLLVIGLPSIFGLGLVIANQLNILSLTDDYMATQQVVIDGSAYNTSSKDPFEFLRVELENDLLTIEVSFSGSQKGHDFELIGTGDFMESSPIQTSLVLSHDSNGDLGEALITKELNFDLNPLKNAFFSVYSFFSPDQISLQINLESYGDIIYNL